MKDRSSRRKLLMSVLKGGTISFAKFTCHTVLFQDRGRA